MPEQTYVCASCKGVFVDPDFDVALDEATRTFEQAELRNADVVCDDCWRQMREQMPDLDARYGIHMQSAGDPS